MWTKEDVDFNCQIMVEDWYQAPTSDYFERRVLLDSIRDPFARERGFIYFQEIPKMDVREAWKNIVRGEKEEFNF